jgi:RNA polymerase sigma-70 factor (ECF subfamily)
VNEKAVNDKTRNTNAAVDSGLLGDLLDHHSAALGLFARQWCSSPDDVVQEAFLKLAEQERAPSDPVAWLYRVVRNRAISRGRSESRRRRHEREAATRRAPWVSDTSEDRPAIAQIDAQAAADALETLPAEDREIVVARLWGGLTFQQIGQLIGASDSAAHRRYTKAIEALKAALSGNTQ